MSRIALLCATRRGYRVLQRISELAPEADLTIFSFRETAHEPPFFEDINHLARDLGATFHEARQVGAPKWRDLWRQLKPDLLLCVSWRYMVPPEVMLSARGAYVFHDSLLPAYRGFSPTVWAIVNGEKQTGATLFEMAKGVDSGGIVAQQPVPIGSDEDIAAVMDRVTEAYLEILSSTLPALLAGPVALTPQDHRQASYTCQRSLEDNRIIWGKTASAIFDLVRAVTRPYPGAFTTLDGAKLTIWSASRLPDYPPYVGSVPGRVVELRDDGAVVLTGSGALLIRDVQLDGGERTPANKIIPNFSTLGR